MTKYLIQLSVLILSIISAFGLFARQPEVLLTHYSTKEGLVNNAISDILQDSKGFVWIATWDGLSRFDGYDFVNYKTGSESKVPLLHNRISRLFEDKLGNIWLSMYDEKLFRLNRRTEKIENATLHLSNRDNIRITSSLVATNGDIWSVVTDRGVVHFTTDSSTFELTTQLFPIQDKVNQLYEDSHGVLWAATAQGAIGFYQEAGVYAAGPSLFNEHSVNTICENGGKIYFGTADGELIIYDQQSKESSKIRVYSGSPVISMIASPDSDYIYMGVKGVGLMRYALSKGNIAAAISQPLDFTNMFIDSHGLVWMFSNRQGVTKYDPKRNSYRDFTQKVIVPEYFHQLGRIMERSGVVWVQMNRGGFGYYDRERDSFEYFNNNPDDPTTISNVVATFWVDPSNVVWLTPHTRGLDKLVILDKKVERLQTDIKPDRLLSNELRAFCYDRDSCLWIAAKSGILYHYDSRMRLMDKISHDDKGAPLGLIYTIVQDNRGYVWLGTKGNGLFRISEKASGKGYKFQHFKHDANDPYSLSSDNVYSVLIDSSNRIWVGTYRGGVNIFTEREGNVQFISARNSLKGYPISTCDKVRTLGEDSEGNIWAGTTEGLVVMCYDSIKKDVHTVVVRKNMESKTSLSSNDIVYIYKDRAKNMWLATFGGGLVKYLGKNSSAEPEFRAYTTKDGLPSNEVMSIVEDGDGIIWFATERNICSFDPDRGIFSTLSKQEGVDDIMLSESAAITLPDGDILFGSLDGYYRVNKELLSDIVDFGFKLEITDFQLNEESIYERGNEAIIQSLHSNNSVTIPDRHMVFSFRYASLNSTIQGRVHYQYILEGYDKEWVNDNGTRKATYADIPRGRYVFTVKAFLLERPDVYESRSMEVIVPPFWWETTIAFIGYGLVLIAVIVAVWWRWFRQETRMRGHRVLKIGPSEIAFRDDRDYKFVSKLVEWLEENYADPELKVVDMASISGMSRTSFYNRLKELTQLSPIEFITDFRLKKAKMYIKDSNLTITEIAYKVGFNDSVYFARVFKSNFGLSPSEYRKSDPKSPSVGD